MPTMYLQHPASKTMRPSHGADILFILHIGMKAELVECGEHEQIVSTYLLYVTVAILMETDSGKSTLMAKAPRNLNLWVCRNKLGIFSSLGLVEGREFLQVNPSKLRTQAIGQPAFIEWLLSVGQQAFIFCCSAIFQ